MAGGGTNWDLRAYYGLGKKALKHRVVRAVLGGAACGFGKGPCSWWPSAPAVRAGDFASPNLELAHMLRFYRTS